MRHAISIPVLAAFVTLAAILAATQGTSAADKPAAANRYTGPTKIIPGTLVAPRPPATLDKVKALGEHLGRALEIGLDLLSGNEAELFSKNKAALLSGNKAALLSGNSANLLSGNAPKVLSDNTTPILSGNSFSMFSNFKVEIHIENSGNGAGALPGAGRMAPTIAVPRASRQVEQPSSRTYQPPSIPGLGSPNPNVGPR